MAASVVGHRWMLGNHDNVLFHTYVFTAAAAHGNVHSHVWRPTCWWKYRARTLFIRGSQQQVVPAARWFGLLSFIWVLATERILAITFGSVTHQEPIKSVSNEPLWILHHIGWWRIVDKLRQLHSEAFMRLFSPATKKNAPNIYICRNSQGSNKCDSYPSCSHITGPMFAQHRSLPYVMDQNRTYHHLISRQTQYED